MTNEQAVDELDYIKQYFHVDGESLDLGIQALEKQIPRTTEITNIKVKALDIETEQVLTYNCSPCPSCSKWLTTIDKYCQYCGQAIDWKEV